jgi:hypothetical protein
MNITTPSTLRVTINQSLMGEEETIIPTLPDTAGNERIPLLVYHMNMIKLLYKFGGKELIRQVHACVCGGGGALFFSS